MKSSNVKFNFGKYVGRLLILLSVGVALTLSQPGIAQADDEMYTPHVLDDTVVTSTSKTKMLDTPASISVITAADLEQMGAKNILEALERIPGVYNTTASNSSLTIRATRSSMAGGPVILIDGVPQNYGKDRREQLDFIPVSQIAKIEVLRSAGVAYGAGAARGVINIITKKPKGEKPLGANFSTTFGSWNTNTFYGALDGRRNQWDYYADYSYYGTDGYEEEKDDRIAALLKLGYNVSSQTRIGIRGNWVNQDRENAYGLYKYAWQLENYRREKHFPRSETDDRLVWHNYKEQETGTYGLEFSHKGNQLFADGALSYTDYEEIYHDTKDIYYSSSTARGDVDERKQDSITANLSAGYRLNINGISYTPSIGVNYETVDFTQRRFYPYDTEGDRDTRRYDLDLDEKSYGIFWDNDFMFTDQWGLKIGNRIDKVEPTLKNKRDEKVKADETAWSWVIAPSYHINSNTNIYVSANRNYWFPSPQYYFWAQNYEHNDPDDLKPEENTTYEIGFKQRLSRAFNTSMTAYYSKTADKFSGLYVGGDYNGQKNMGDARTYGLEIEIDGRPIDWFGYRFSGAYINAEWESGEGKIYDPVTDDDIVVSLEGYKIHGVPELCGHAGLDFYPMKGLKASIDANISGDYYLDYTNRFSYPSYTTVDASVSYSWAKYKMWLLGKNIFDREVERALNSDGELDDDGNPLNSYYVLDGFYLEMGLSIAF